MACIKDSCRVSIHIASKDRHSELSICLQSLRTQTFKDWDLIIIDESQTPITNCHFLMAMINRIKLENHKVKIVRNQISQGVCYARNLAIKSDTYEDKYTLRCDDDVVLEPNYIELLLAGLSSGYDLITGVVPLLSTPEHIRETEKIGKIMNLHVLDSEGNLIENKDECAFCYDKAIIILNAQFRTNALYKSEINKVVSYPSHLSFVGFREEGFFSFKAILAGYKLGVHTQAVAYHLQTPSGGCRTPNYVECVKQDDECFRKWIKEKFKERGNFLEKYQS